MHNITKHQLITSYLTVDLAQQNFGLMNYIIDHIHGSSY
jgi:hypothetical protein